MKNFPEITNHLNVCVIVPTYNNEKTLASVITELKAYSYPVIVVNDGSTDSTASILSAMEEITVCSYPENQGKGFALQTGFKKAVELDFDYALTIDSDGQHNPSDIPVLLEKSAENPNAIIIGARNLQEKNMPGKNTFANKFANFWFLIETGKKLPDTQSGFRIYPLKQIVNRKYFTKHYDFELEVLVRSVWQGLPVIPVPIRVFYAPKTEQISHFRPVLDFTRISILNTFLVLIALFWVKPFAFAHSINKKNVKTFFKEHILASNYSNLQITLSVMLGIFLGIIPIWGYQMLVAYGLAHVFKLNRVIALVASNISIPPMLPFILYGSFATGAWALGKPFKLNLSHITFVTMKQDIIQYIIGSILLAIISAIAFGIITCLLLSIFRKIKP
ncbi:glycosyl transferase [Bacteroidia bacterium]|nr:glycosyl transferase [Bacteroidia bacterium]